MTGVGIVGAGRIGQAMVRVATRAGRSVVIANSRGPESLVPVTSELGERVLAGTVAQAASAGIVVLAVPWDRVREAVQGLSWNGQIVIDATNGLGADGRQENIERDGRRHRCRRTGRQGCQHARRALATGGAMQQVHHPLAGVNLIQL